MDKTIINVEIELTETQLGTVPNSKGVYTDYVATGVPMEQRLQEAEGIQEDPEDSKPAYTTFMEDEKGIYILNYLILGMLRNAGNNLKEHVGIKQLKSKLENFVFVKPRKVYFERDGVILKKPDGSIERPLTGVTAQGRRTIIARSDYVSAGTILKFELTLLKHKEITPDVLEELLKYGEYCGLGQWRTSSMGTFKVNKFEVQK